MTLLMQTSIVLFLAILVSATGWASDIEITSGVWMGKGYAIDVGWKIVARDNKNFIVFDKQFKTKNGPDLKVYLSRKPINEVKGSDVAHTSVKISPLTSNKGAQKYEIPGEVNLNEFTSMLIHCEAYEHLWGGAALN